MCGIAGVLNLGDHAPPTLEELNRMASAMRHRGPDEFGAFRDTHCGLAHARLSIIDLSTGQQPMCNETGTLWCIFNGEIFNYVELRVELTALGHTFKTKSDTEVIVHAYEAWGPEAFERFNGQWAVALWDAARQELVLSRDRVGVRPLHLCQHDGRLFFASEVKSIFAADPGIPRELDPVGLAETFTFWSIVPPQSVFRGVEELPPGVTRTISRTSARTTRDFVNWSPAFPTSATAHRPSTLGEATEQVERALLDATRLRMLRADVPVGSYLSGGLDSSLVAAMGREVMGQRFHTFSLRFADAEYDETRFQHLMAERLETEHHEVIVSRQDIAGAFSDVIFHTERPILRTAPAPLFLLSRLVRDTGIKVVLTGEGADEMFGGYDLFREAKVRRFWARQPMSQARPRLLERLYPYLARSPVKERAITQAFFGRGLEHWRAPGFSHGPRWQSASALRRLFSAPVREAASRVDVVSRFLSTLPSEFSQYSFLAQDQLIEIRTLLSGYLLSSQGDRMLMGHSVEGRFPFLDANVMELAARLPPGFKLRGLDEKHVLKLAAKSRVPAEIIERKKQPYRAPDAIAFTGSTAPPYVGELLSTAAITRTGIFEPGPTEALVKKCLGRADDAQFSNADNMALVGVLSTQLLHHHFVDRRMNLANVTFNTLHDATRKGTRA